MPFRVVFCGTSAFAVPSLDALAGDSAVQLELVVTQPDRPVGRARTLTPPPIKAAALRHGVPLWQPDHIRREFSSRPAIERPDFLIVVSYGQILSQEILDWPTVAPVNVHASLLPRWRGASPLQHAILSGDAETGVTVQQMVLALDAGSILGQSRTRLDPRETYVSLHDRLAQDGAALLTSVLKKPLTPTPQDERSATVCTQLTREDGLVDPAAMSAEAIDRKVRALNPWPSATWNRPDGSLKILETALESSADAYPLPCVEGTMLHLTKVQPAGKKPMSGAEWARGLR